MRDDGLEQQHEPPIYDSGLLAQRLIVIARVIHQDPDERVDVSQETRYKYKGLSHAR